MKTCLKRIIISLVLCASASLIVPSTRAQQNGEAPLTNAAVVKLVRAGFREKTVIAIIQTRPSSFDLSPDRLIELKKSGVSEHIILAMLARDENRLGTDEWGDDPFFGDSNRAARVRRSDGTTGDGGADIFGMGGGSSSRTRGRAQSGANQDDTQSTGSATVRILRPPAEAGGAPPKLERTPTLTNDAIVELVEAGFSEGTIIRRIEQSPAEFDLSPNKLAELRRRRVTEAVIAAMRAAMSDDSTSSAKP